MLPLVAEISLEVPTGYSPTRKDAQYDAKKQRCVGMQLMGESSPTTYSRIDSTGIISSDADEDQDDTGKD